MWATKYRRKILKYYVRDELVKSLYKVIRRHPDWYIHNVNTGEDHVHIMMEIPPKYRVTDAVRDMKIETSKGIKKRFKFVRKIYDGKEGMWSTGFFVSTIGLNEEIIRKYIDKQNNYDKGIDITEEFS